MSEIREPQMVPPGGEEPLPLTRREALSGTAQVALAAAFAAAPSLALVACTVPRGEPWQDETFWDDGTGWIDA